LWCDFKNTFIKLADIFEEQARMTNFAPSKKSKE